MELWTFVMECNQEDHTHDLSGLGLSSVMSFDYVDSRYCTIKNTVGAGIHLTMSLLLDTKSIVLNEPALLVIVIYGASGLGRRGEEWREWLGSRCSNLAGVSKLDARHRSKLCLDWRKRY